MPLVTNAAGDMPLVTERSPPAKEQYADEL
jgi:hypothetical protein